MDCFASLTSFPLMCKGEYPALHSCLQANSHSCTLCLTCDLKKNMYITGGEGNLVRSYSSPSLMFSGCTKNGMWCFFWK